jgi:hypothetical protein
MRPLLGLLFTLNALAIAPTLLAAESSPIRLVCKHAQTVDESGKTSPASGEVLFTVTFDAKGIAQIKKEGLGVPLSGKVAEDEISGQVTYKLQDLYIEETVTINRYTGSMKLTYRVTGRGGLVHYGECRSATQRLF